MAQRYSPTVRMTAPTSAPPVLSMPPELLHVDDLGTEPEFFQMDDAEPVQEFDHTYNFDLPHNNTDPSQEVVHAGAHLARVDEGSAYRSLAGQLANSPIEVPCNVSYQQASLKMDFTPVQRPLPDAQLPASMPQTIACPVDAPMIAVSQWPQYGTTSEQTQYVDPNYDFMGSQYDDEVLTSTPFNSFQSTSSSWLPSSGPQSSFDLDRLEQDLQSSNTAPSSFDMSMQYFPGQSSIPSAPVALPYMRSRSELDGTSSPMHADRLHEGYVQMTTRSRSTNVSSWTQGAYNVMDRTNFGGLAPTPAVPPSSRRARGSHSRTGSVATLPCENCGKIFLSKSARDHHARWHGPKAQICATCDKGFVAMKDLRRHEKTHKPAEHEFFCEHPGCTYQTKGFARKDHFTRHQKTHGNAINPLDVIPGFSATF